MNDVLKNFLKDENFEKNIPLNTKNVDLYVSLLRSMVTIRKAEEQLALGRKNGLIGGPVHLGAGQEAIAVGVSKNLRKTDCVFGNHRSHAHLLALNPDVYKLFAEILGKKTGFSKGMGGSMHLFDKTNGFYGSTPIVAGTVPLAVGAGLAFKMRKLDNIAVSYIGDGAVEEGVVHECLNLAKVLKIPILFVIENNLFASHMHISLRQPSEIISRYAIANKIPHKVLDGNDVVTISKETEKIINKIRSSGEPGFVELITYRFYGHVDWREDIDVGVARSLKDIEYWKARDPINRLSKSLNNCGILSKKDQYKLYSEIDSNITSSWNKAIEDSYPSKDAILKFVYSEN